jgi:hypothetical protein
LLANIFLDTPPAAWKALRNWREGIAYSLAERTALSNRNLVTIFDTERWADVCSQVLVSLLITGVLGDEVEVFAADDKSSMHLCGNDGAGEDTATNGDESSEWALLV